MNCEIVYVCNSANNKNVRANELTILRKFEDKLYFEFGDSENNIKKRFYSSIEVLNKDFDEIAKIKEKLEKEKEEEELEKKAEEVIKKIGEELVDNEEIKPKQAKTEIFKKTKNRENNKKNIF